MLSFFLMKKKGDAWGKLEGLIFPAARFSLRKSLVAFFSLGESGWILPILDVKDLPRLILWSYSLEEGMWSVASLEKTWVKSTYSDRRGTLGFTFSIVIVSLVTVVSLTMTGEFRSNLLQSPWRILLMR